MNAKEAAKSFLNAPSTLKVDGAEAVYLMGELLKEYDTRIEERDAFQRVSLRLESENRTLRQVVTENAENFDAGRLSAAKECSAIADETSTSFKPGSWDQQACLAVSKAIRAKFGLEI